MNRAVDIFLHDIERFILGGEEIIQFIIAFELIGMGRAHAVIRLDDDRIAHLGDEVLAAGVIAHQMPARRFNTRLGVIRLHRGLKLHRLHICRLEAGFDIECGAQRGVALQPILIIAFQPINFSVLIGQKSDGAEDLIVVFQRRNLIILVQRAAQFRHELVIRAIADAQNIHAVLFQRGAEFPVIRREIRGDKDEIFHGDAPLRFRICGGRPEGFQNVYGAV